MRSKWLRSLRDSAAHVLRNLVHDTAPATEQQQATAHNKYRRDSQFKSYWKSLELFHIIKVMKLTI